MSEKRGTKPPTVSVLMTAYNRTDFIGEAIASVLASTLTDLELIVVDDASKDGTVEIARRYAAMDPRVQVHVNPQNLGDYVNRNHAASLARGKYLKYLDSDDVIYPHGLAVMVACMEQFPEAGFGLSAHSDRSAPHPLFLDPHAAYRRHFLEQELFGRAPGSAIIKTEAFREAGGFTGKRQVGDHEFWLIMGRKYPVVTLPRDLVWDRTHGAQEQFFDSAVDKARMHGDVALEALNHPDCPLSEDERELARRIMDRRNAKTFWRYALRQRAPGTAMRFRRATDLSWSQLFAFWNRPRGTEAGVIR